jgi:hypothetical protein
MTWSVDPTVNAILRPSGDQAGQSPRCNLRKPPPRARTTWTWKTPRPAAKAMRLPFRDHCGRRGIETSRPPPKSRRNGPPRAGTVYRI